MNVQFTQLQAAVVIEALHKQAREYRAQKAASAQAISDPAGKEAMQVFWTKELELIAGALAALTSLR